MGSWLREWFWGEFATWVRVVGPFGGFKEVVVVGRLPGNFAGPINSKNLKKVRISTAVDKHATMN
jgi:hypothetical protein